MEYDYIEEFKRFADVLKSLEKDNKKLRERIDELDGAKKDIRHIYEFGEIDAIDMMQLASTYRNNLKRRREALNKHKITKSLLHSINKNLEGNLKYIAEEVKEEVEQDRNYYARSKLGQSLINKYSSEGDDLVTSPSEDEIKELVNKYN